MNYDSSSIIQSSGSIRTQNNWKIFWRCSYTAQRPYVMVIDCGGFDGNSNPTFRYNWIWMIAN